MVDGGDEVLLEGPDPAGVELGVADHPQQVGGGAQIGTGIDRVATVLELVQGGHQRGGGRSQA